MNYDEMLVDGAKKGDLAKVKEALANGADIHFKNDYPLRWAVSDGHLEMVKYLVFEGADIHVKDDEPAQLAASNGHLDVVKYLVSEGADIHAGGNYALRRAAENGHLEVVKYLVGQGADVHARNDEAAGQAAERGHFAVARFLKEYDDHNGKTPEAVNKPASLKQQVLDKKEKRMKKQLFNATKELGEYGVKGAQTGTAATVMDKVYEALSPKIDPFLPERLKSLPFRDAGEKLLISAGLFILLSITSKDNEKLTKLRDMSGIAFQGLSHDAVKEMSVIVDPLLEELKKLVP